MGAWFSRDDAAAAPLPTPSAVADVGKQGTVASRVTEAMCQGSGRA